MARTLRKENTTKVTLSIPIPLLEEIDRLCLASFSSRSTWFLQAAKDKLEREKLEREKNLLNKLKEWE